MMKMVMRIDFSRLRRRGLWRPLPKKSILDLVLANAVGIELKRLIVMQFEANSGQKSWLRVLFGGKSRGWRDGGLSLDARVGLGSFLGDLLNAYVQ